MSSEEQHHTVAFLSVTFDCLSLSLNSGFVAEFNRIAKDEYLRRPQRGRPSLRRLWKLGNGMIRGGEESDDRVVDAQGVEVDDAESPPPDEPLPAGHPRYRRGLGLTATLADTGLLWLPRDMFLWDPPRFLPSALRQTAYVTSAFVRAFGKSVRFALEDSFRAWVTDLCARQPGEDDKPFRRRLRRRVFRPLWHALAFRYSAYILRQLERGGHLPAFHSPHVSEGERAGRFGLSYGLARRLLGDEPEIGLARGGGGNAADASQGLSGFPATHAVRVQLLFGLDDDYDRGKWEKAPFRTWVRFIHSHLGAVAGGALSSAWLSGIGEAIRPYLTTLPRYEANKLYQVQKVSSGLSQRERQRRQARGKGLVWITALPDDEPDAVAARSPLDVDWVLAVAGKSARPLFVLPDFLNSEPTVVSGCRIPDIDPIAGAEAAESADDARSS